MNTPRTDEAWNKAPTDDVVFANAGWDFARQLETELIAMTAMADRLAEAMKNSCNFPGCKNWHPESDNAIAAYENHKKPEQQIKQPCDCIEKCGKYWIQRCDCQNSTSLAEAQNWCDHENNKKGNAP